MYVVAQSHLCLYILHAVYHTYVPYQRGLFEPKTIHLANGACGNAYLIQPCFGRVPSSGRPVVAIQQKKTSPTKFQQFSILQLAKNPSTFAMELPLPSDGGTGRAWSTTSRPPSAAVTKSSGGSKLLTLGGRGRAWKSEAEAAVTGKWLKVFEVFGTFWDYS